METSRTPAHNFWHSLARTEKPGDDQKESGIYIQGLQKGDVVRFETLRGSDGFAARVTIKVTHPKQGGIQILQVVRFLGGLVLETKAESLGNGIAGFFVLRGDKYDGRKFVLGYVGIGCDVHLAGDTVFKSVKNISLNNTLITFPLSSKNLH